jgi:hypothetical protein
VNRITAPCVLQGRIPIAVVAQLVEQLIRNQQVSGSNPLNGSIIFNHLAAVEKSACLSTHHFGS